LSRRCDTGQLAKRAKCELLQSRLRRLREAGMVADAVAIEPVSVLCFPANREKYREIL
jgi:hypothetical protein